MTAHLAALIQDALGPDYRIEQELDGGGMSRLFMATDLRLNRRVVVKVLSPELVTDTSTARFKREIELTVRLQHPHILPILTSGTWQDVLYYITPFIPGESLKARIERDHKLPLNDIIRILRDASGALAFAHARGVVHRDVKPGNILLAEGHAILADFGIARAVATQTSQLTVTGVMPGTPAYMAPELPTEEMQDVYALGVVAYEMLVGMLPRRGVTAKEILAGRGRVAGDSRARVCALAELIVATVSRPSEATISSASDFSIQLDQFTHSHSRLRTSAFGIAATAVIILLLVGAWVKFRTHVSPPSSLRYVVAVGGGSADSEAVHETRIARSLTDAIGEWEGPEVVASERVDDAKQSTASGRGTTRDLEAVARALGAQNLVIPHLEGLGDSAVLTVTLIDAVRDSTIRKERIAVARGEIPASVIRRLASKMLRDADEIPAAGSARLSLASWRAYDAGKAALSAWKLREARERFEQSLLADPKNALSNLWSVQSAQWIGERRPQGDDEARLSRALVVHSLTPRDSVHAVALHAFVTKDYPKACEAYRRLIAADSASWIGWLGIGDCQAFDRTVIQDPRSQSGWRFRSSFHQASRAYDRARMLGPPLGDALYPGWLIGRLREVLFGFTYRVRQGSASGQSAPMFLAYPFLDGDTLAFVPYPLSDFGRGKGDPPEAKLEAAVRVNREVLQRAAEDWVARAPTSASAFDSLASFTEIATSLASVKGRQLTAIEVVQEARKLSKDSTQQLRLAIAEVRLSVKSGTFERARLLADSILRVASSRVAEVQGFPGLAALTGHEHETSVLLPVSWVNYTIRTASGRQITPPQPVVEAGLALLSYAAFGMSVDSILWYRKRTYELTDSYYADSAERNEVRAALTERPLTLAYPLGSQFLRGSLRATDPDVRAIAALTRGDTSTARREAAGSRANARRFLPGSVAMDGTYMKARIALALGDTAAATEQLDRVLRALPTLGVFLLDQLPQSTTLVRSMILRADLAALSGDRQAAVQWASAVNALWGGGDRSVQSTVARMKTIIGGPR